MEHDEQRPVPVSFPSYRRWYAFGSEAPVVLYKRLRNKYRPILRLRMSWQRARYGYSEDQLWSLDYSLAELTVAGVRKMREWAHGYPAEFSGWKEWDEILGRIEAGFQAWLDEDGWFGDNSEAEAKFKDAMSLYAEWFSALWD